MLAILDISIETKGMEQVSNMIRFFQKFGAKVGGVKLNARKRVAWTDKDGITHEPDTDGTNEDIMNYLKRSGRDFFSADSQITQAISAAAAVEMQKRLDGNVGKKFKSKKAPDAALSKLANDMLSGSLKEGIFAWMRAITKRIEDQEVAGGGSPSPLSKGYREWKLKKRGWAEPIGKLTGQLIDNLNPDGLGGRNVRFTKGKTK